jgi:OOP family OmpA-OmpF porin
MFHALTKYIRIEKYRFFIFCLVFLFFSGIVKGNASADSTKKLQREYLKKASKSNRNRDIYKAIYYYQSYIDAGGKKKDATFKLGTLYYITRDYNNSEIVFENILKISGKKNPMVYYYNGIVCMNLEKYEDAIKNFEAFRKRYIVKYDQKKLKQLANNYIESSNWAIAHKDSIFNITVSNLGSGINKAHIEFSPLPLTENSMLFGAYIEDSTSDRLKLRKIYSAEKINNRWQTVGEFDRIINSTAFHTGNPSITADGKKIYFTRCHENWKKEMICEIFTSQLIDNEWTEPVHLPYPINDENYTSTQPTLGKNQRNNNDILYFVSNRSGGKGGLDIWYTQFDRHTNEFQPPRNAGNKVNTPADECCPFYDIKNQTLYFGSKGMKGFGGFDIYKSTGSTRTWTDPEILPKPINSSFDDMYYTTIKNGEEGFFTSNRPGTNTLSNGSCCDDIFSFKYNECTKISLRGKVYNVTNYDIYDELNRKFNLHLNYPANNAPVSGVPVNLYKIEKKEAELLVSQTTTNSDGDYDLMAEMNQNYKLVVRNFGYFDKVISFSTIDLNCSDTLDMGISQVNILPELTIRVNIYYEHDKFQLTKDAMTIIDTTLLAVFDQFPSAVVEIGSHTDNTGSDNYNIKLSQKRSESVVNYLIGKGISADRLIAKGYGESQPIAPNSNPDGSDNPVGRQFNRRTELKIVGELSSFYIDE